MYSLGNFWFNSKTVDTGMVKVVLNENGLQSLQFISPACRAGAGHRWCRGGEEQDPQLHAGLSGGVQIDDDGYVIKKFLINFRKKVKLFSAIDRITVTVLVIVNDIDL